MIRELIATSVRSFQGKVPRAKAKYLFVIEEEKTKKIFGASLIVAQQGTRLSPHIYFEKRGGLLRFGAATHGPTEIGGLILKKRFRRRREKFGKQLSWVRFLYMAAHPERFQGKVLAEFLPPLRKGKESLFWDAFGKKFTGLSYHEADRLSVTTKEFVFDLFPKRAELRFLPKKVRALLGKVSPEADPACRMLTKLGFRKTDRIEPFDGGPYYEAELKRISVIRKARKVLFEGRKTIQEASGTLFLLERKGKVRAGVGRTASLLKPTRKEMIFQIPFQ